MNSIRLKVVLTGSVFILATFAASQAALAETGYPMMRHLQYLDMMGPDYCQGEHVPQGMGMHSRMPPGSRGMGMMVFGQSGRGVMGLNLTDDQELAVQKLQHKLRRQNWSLKGDILDEQGKLIELYAVDIPDAAVIGKVYDAIFDIKRQMIENRINTENEVQALLTTEQKTQFKSGQMGNRGYMGRHGMMRW